MKLESGSEDKIIIFDLDDTLYDRYGQLDESYANLPNIRPFQDTIPLLKSLKGKKILVSRGDKLIQQKKIDILGIRSFFDEIYICSNVEEKKEIFENTIKEQKIVNKKNLIIVGDRIDAEIRFGKMLGATTVLILHGKYKDLKPKDAFEIPDYTIKNIGEIRELIQ